MSDQIKENFYSTLGVAKEATKQEIKKAYRNLALQHHPDKNSSPQANEVFQKISAAYETLGDEMKRTTYDGQFPATKDDHPREEEKPAEEPMEADKKSAVEVDKKGGGEVDKKEVEADKEAVEADKKDAEQHREAPEVATMATPGVDDGERATTLRYIEALKRARKAEAEEKGRSGAGGSKEAAEQEAPKERERNPDGAATRFPVFPTPPPTAFRPKPPGSAFPNRPKGPIPRPLAADRAATRFPVVPQAAHLAEYKKRHPSPGP